MILNPFRFGSSAPAAPLLDTYGSALCAYSVRKLRTAYGGYCMKVTTSAAGNATQDIGFDGSGNLDATALLAFIGANDGTIATWYDQSGNGLDVTQATIANQPKIVSAGVLVTVNSRASPLGNGTSTSMQSGFSYAGLKAAKQLTCAAVHKSSRTSSASEGIFGLQRSTGYSYQSGYSYTRRNTNLSMWFGSGSIAAFNTTLFQGRSFGDSNTTALSAVQSFINGTGGTQWMYIDGVGPKTLSLVSGTLSQGSFMSDASTASHRVLLFADTDNANVINAWFQGNIPEVVSWPTDQVANVAGIKANQSAYFGTP